MPMESRTLSEMEYGSAIGRVGMCSDGDRDRGEFDSAQGSGSAANKGFEPQLLLGPSSTAWQKTCSVRWAGQRWDMALRI